MPSTPTRKQKAKVQAEAGIAVSSEHGIPMFSTMGTIFRGWALIEQGQEEEGVAQICQGLAGFRISSGGECLRPHLLALLADTYVEVGKAEEGLSTLPKRWRWSIEQESVPTKPNSIDSKASSSSQESPKSKVPKVQSPNAQNPKSQGRGRRMFPQSHRDIPQATS